MKIYYTYSFLYNVNLLNICVNKFFDEQKSKYLNSLKLINEQKRLCLCLMLFDFRN